MWSSSVSVIMTMHLMHEIWSEVGYVLNCNFSIKTSARNLLGKIACLLQMVACFKHACNPSAYYIFCYKRNSVNILLTNNSCSSVSDWQCSESYAVPQCPRLCGTWALSPFHCGKFSENIWWQTSEAECEVTLQRLQWKTWGYKKHFIISDLISELCF